jgi:hypothetical protein
MFMGKKNAIQFLALAGKHLLPEIRTAIYNIRSIVPLYPYGYTQAFVTLVIAKANRMITAYYRYAL